MASICLAYRHDIIKRLRQVWQIAPVHNRAGAAQEECVLD